MGVSLAVLVVYAFSKQIHHGGVQPDRSTGKTNLDKLRQRSDSVDSLVLLEWDTAFFGFPIARIVNPRAHAEELRDAAAQMRERQIPLAYWTADNPSPEAHAQAIELGATLVDEKLTFVANVVNLTGHQLPAMPLVEPYHDGMSLAELKQLAIDSSKYSRFVVDPTFPQTKARALFEEWMVRSVNKVVADEVIVIRHESHIAGMVTLAHAGTRASIGLLAVAERFRGRKFGEALVRTAQQKSCDHGCSEVQVITQQANAAAQRLYYKCGFELQKTESCYHLWSTPGFVPPM